MLIADTVLNRASTFATSTGWSTTSEESQVHAAGTVPVEKLPDEHLAVDRHDRGAGTASLQAAPHGGRSSDLAHLDPGAGALSSFDIQLEVQLHTAASGDIATTLSRSSYQNAYWAPAQLVAHHSSNGCRLRPGDLMGTGTQSGPGVGEQGCLLELTCGGRAPLRLHSNEQRAYLEDGDTVVLRAWCERDGAARIGFGACRGTVLAAAPAD
jgi:2-keto-4-pentenoate hydratase/2-oxohepta-3-ene-1,7-dioic acid hydratase in catechol pathway